MKWARTSSARLDPSLIDDLADTLDAIDLAKFDGRSHIARARLDYRKWKLIQDFVTRYPVADRPNLVRSAQWREVVEHVRPLNDLEILDWALQQVEIAAHHETGIQDLRPHGSGPCQNLLLRHVSGRKQKANLVLKWALANAEESDQNG